MKSSSFDIFDSNNSKKNKQVQKKVSKTISTVENNIVDVKNFYMNYLISILKPSLIDSINSMYIEIVKTKDQKNISIQEMKLFKESLKNISFLDRSKKLKILIQIKDNTNSRDILDKSIKALIKSYVILLTFNTTNNLVKKLRDDFYKQVDISEFIFRCYVEFSLLIFFNTDIFIKYHHNQFNSSEQINEMVCSAIETTLYKILPMTDIINNFIDNEDSTIQNDNKLLIDVSKYIISKISKQTENLDEKINNILKFIECIKENNSSNIENKMEYSKNDLILTKTLTETEKEKKSSVIKK